MTNSQALRPKRFNPRSLVILGMAAAAVTVPVVLIKPHLTDVCVLFNEMNRAQPSSTFPRESKRVSAPAAPAAIGTDSASYLKALDRAARELSAQVEKTPTDPSLQNRLGLIYLSIGDLSSAKQSFTNAIGLCRSALSDCSRRIEQARLSNRFNAASVEFLKASALTVELSAAHSSLARVYDQLGDRQKVVEQLEQLSRDGQLFHGITLSGEGLKTGDGRLTPVEAQLLAAAEQQLAGNQLDVAVADYKRLAQMNPRLSVPHERLGLIYAMSHDLAGAIEELEQAAKLQPGSASIQNNLGMAYLQMGMIPECRRCFRRALELDPKLEDAALNLGNLLSADGRMDDALSILEEAARVNPKSGRAQNNLAAFLAMSGRHQEAISSYHRAISADPGMASAYYGMGVSLIKIRQYLPAIRQLKHALALNPNMVAAQTRIEEAYRLAGRRG